MTLIHRLIFSFVFLIALPAIAQAQSVNFFGVEFPAEFAGGQRTGSQDFESRNPGLGYGVGYRHRGATSSLYLYDVGLSSIPDDLNAPVVINQFKQARGDIGQAPALKSAATSEGSFMVRDGAGQPRLACEGFELVEMSPPRDSYLCLGVLRGKFFKVRTTMLKDSGSKAEMQRFVGAWVERLWPKR